MSHSLVLVFLPQVDAASVSDSSAVASGFDEATSVLAPGVSVSQAGDNTLAVGPGSLLFDLPDLLAGRTATVVALSGVSDTYIVEEHGGGDRLRVVVEGEIVEDNGASGDHETLLSSIDDPEDAHLAYFCALAGVTENELAALPWRPWRR